MEKTLRTRYRGGTRNIPRMKHRRSTIAKRLNDTIATSDTQAARALRTMGARHARRARCSRKGSSSRGWRCSARGKKGPRWIRFAGKADFLDEFDGSTLLDEVTHH